MPYAIRQIFTRIRAVSLFLTLAFAASLAAAAPGDVSQVTLLKIPGNNSRSYATAVQPDGKLLAAGYAHMGTKQFAITRYNTDGTVDTAFGDAGTRLEWLGPSDAEAHAIAVQSNGRIVVAGFAVSDVSRFAIAGFNPDGSLDTSFGGGGAVTTVGTGSGALAMALQADDKIVLGGWSISGGKKVFALARYQASTPVLDTSFGSGGIVVAAADALDEQANALAMQSDGKIVAVGSYGSNDETVIRRYNADGSLDTSFGSGGTQFATLMTDGHAVAVLSNGNILVAGEYAGAFTVARFTAAGALDTTFGVNGYAQQGNGSSSGHGNAMQVQADGKILVAGTGASGSVPAYAIARFNADGSNDTGFGNSGVTIVRFSLQGDEGDALAILPSGELVIAGASGRNPADCACTSTTSAVVAMIIGFTSSGVHDQIFAGGGRGVERGSKEAAGLASALQSDGKLVIVGLQHPTPSETDHVVDSITVANVVRYNADGSLDTSFGPPGSGVPGIVTSAPDQLRAVAIQSDGKIVAAGYAEGNFQGVPANRMALVRLNSDGTADTSFGGTGIVYIPLDGPGEEANSIALQSDGKIVVGGVGQLQGSFPDALFARLNTDGSLDTTFGGSGKVRVAMSTGSDQLNAVAIQSDGKIVGAGWGQLSGSQDGFAAARLNADGTLDSTFGTGGVVTTAIGTSIAHGNAMALQIDGKIVVGGQAFMGSTDDFALVRYNTNGTLDTSFGSGGIVTTDMGNHNRIFALAILPSGKITAAGLWGGSWGIAQYLPSGTLDTAFGSGGTVFLQANVGANDVAHSIVRRSDGNLWVSGDGSGVFALALIAGDSTTATPSIITSPTDGSTLSGSTVTFTWNDGGATRYQVWVGNSVGADDIGYFPAAGTTGTSTTVTGLPTDGRTLYVRLWSFINGAYQFRDFTYKAAGSGGGGGGTPTPATMVSPANGSMLSGSSVTFTWTNSGASLYQVFVGNTQGADDIGYFPASGTTGTSTTATGIPTDGRTIFVRLYSAINGVWQFNDYTYTAAGTGGGGGGTPTPATMVSPANGSMLSGASVMFTWTNSGASLYQIWVGSTQGAYDIGYFPASGTTGTSATATGIPTDGRTIFVRLYSAINGAWQFNDYTYTASGTGGGGGGTPMPATMVSPASGSTLGGASVTFTWTNSGASLYQIWVGSTQGAYDIGYFPASGTTGTSTTATGIPTDGRTIFVRLYSAINGVWQFNDYTYTAAGTGGGGGGTPMPATMVSPANGSTLSGSTVTFTWTNSGASLYQVWVGTTQGAYDVGYFPASGTTGTSATATGLPTDGRMLFVRLYSAINGAWQFNDYTYRSGP